MMWIPSFLIFLLIVQTCIWSNMDGIMVVGCAPVNASEADQAKATTNLGVTTMAATKKTGGKEENAKAIGDL